jgi:hypothetical protein
MTYTLCVLVFCAPASSGAVALTSTVHSRRPGRYRSRPARAGGNEPTGVAGSGSGTGPGHERLPTVVRKRCTNRTWRRNLIVANSHVESTAALTVASDSYVTVVSPCSAGTW